MERRTQTIPYQVTVNLMNGEHLQGTIRSFSADDDSVELFTEAPTAVTGTASAISSRLNANHIAHIAFLKQKHQPVSLAASEDAQQVHIELLHGDVFHVITARSLHRAHGFYAFPVQNETRFSCHFFYHHAISTKKSSDLIGKMLLDAGFASKEAVIEALHIQQAQREQRIGEILQRNNDRITPEIVDEALKKQQTVRKRLGEVLLESGLVDQQDLQRALKQQQHERGKKIGQILIQMGVISELELASTLAKKYHLPLIDLDDYPIDPSAIHEVDAALVRQYQWLPIQSDDTTITMAIPDPLYTDAESSMKFHAKKRVKQVIAVPSQIHSHIERLLSGSDDDDWLWLETLEQDEITQSSSDGEALQLSKAVDAPPIIRIVNKIILDAHKYGASDIHLLPQNHELTLAYRINGELVRMSGLERWLQRRITSRFKLLANMDISETRLPQDGRLRARKEHLCLDFRVSCMPCAYGESLVLRLLRASAPNFTDVGLRDSDAVLIKQLIKRPFGLILTTGPTGSGKSTTLQALVREIIQSPVHVITAEDPIEAEIPGANQIQVNARIGLDFSRILRNVLRHDPDVVMVGEMRDEETARIGIEAALTGHLILSSLHTNSAVDTITRLTDLGIERYLLAPALLGIISQSLAKVLCPHCKVPAPNNDDMAIMLRSLLHMPLPPMFDKKGCERCHQSGYSGRRMVYECLIVDDAMRNSINHGDDSQALQKAAIRSGMYSKQDYALELAADGIICRNELIRLLI
jgi:type II secretory ATPase GspE/PulE/Tfp pilus assembly ATPase PilB-like protein/sRNA-binding regulator protein Hfq